MGDVLAGEDGEDGLASEEKDCQGGGGEWAELAGVLVVDGKVVEM